MSHRVASVIAHEDVRAEFTGRLDQATLTD
jgi:hypothetical protein